ncbi:hypothetical protein BN1110_06260 [bacterium YEK0313]|nr:hypothetical protein BN1110_06260 [bacterium YEK0313]
MRGRRSPLERAIVVQAVGVHFAGGCRESGCRRRGAAGAGRGPAGRSPGRFRARLDLGDRLGIVAALQRSLCPNELGLAIGEAVPAAVDALGHPSDIVAVGETVQAAILPIGHGRHRADVGLAGSFRLALQVDADAGAEGAVIRAARELEDAAPAVTRTVAGLGVAEIPAAVIAREIAGAAIFDERSEPIGLMGGLRQKMRRSLLMSPGGNERVRAGPRWLMIPAFAVGEIRRSVSGVMTMAMGALHSGARPTLVLPWISDRRAAHNERRGPQDQSSPSRDDCCRNLCASIAAPIRIVMSIAASIPTI